MIVSRKPVFKEFTFGICGMLFAALALVVAVADLVIETNKPQKSIEQTIGETAAKIKLAAKQAISGETPGEPVSDKSTFNTRLVAGIATVFLSAVAMLSAILALAYREKRAPAYIAFSLGSGVLLMAWIQWIALLICGTILLIAIINNLGDILPS